MSTKINLATTESITTTYAGEDAGRFVAAATLEAESIQNGAVEAVPNVKYKHVLERLDVSSILKNRTCDFDPSGKVTLAERILQPKELSVNLQLCKANYRNTWTAEQMGFSANDNLAPSLADHIITRVIAKVAQANEISIWSGNSSNDGEFTGFETLFTNEPLQPSGNELAGTTVTSSNVIAQLESVLIATPNALYRAPGFAIYIPVGIAKHYIAAQAALGYRELYHDGATNLNFQGVPLIVCPGMTDDKMFATYAGNFYAGTGLLNDSNEVIVLDMKELDGSDNVRFVMNYTMGVQVAMPEDVITYGITNSGN